MINTRGRLAREPEAVFALIRGEDIIVCTETWLGEADIPAQLPGYVVFHFPRPAPGRRQAQGAARGGVVVYVSQTLARHTTVWRKSAQGTHAWIRIDRAAGLEETLLLAACYIPPKQRNTLSRDSAEAWDSLTADIAAAQAEGMVLLAGDLNARTATLPDWDHNDHMDGAHNAAMLDVVLYSQGEELTPPVCTQRSNQDPKINEYGRTLINICRSTGMRICNGRTAGDREGACTCYPYTGGQSLVDYFLACPGLMPKVRYLAVSPPEVGFDHCAARLELDCIVPAAREAQQGGGASRQGAPQIHLGYRVMPDCIPAFAEHLREATSGGLAALFKEGAAACAEIGDLDIIVAKLDSAIHTSLKAAGMPELRPGAKAARRGPKNPGVDAGTRALRREKRAAVRHADWPLVQRINQELLRLKIRRRRHDKAAQAAALVILAKANRSAFWQKWKTKLSTEGPIAAEEFQAYFEKLFGAGLNSPLPANLSAQTNAAANQHPDNTCLNQPFTAAEVREGLDGLQQRKSVLGYLKLEFLKPVADVLAPVLAELFNACTRLRSLPFSWAMGAITPLLKPGGVPSECNSYRGITVGTLMAKLFATMINKRLTEWTEDNCLRAQGQAGFRQDHRTSDQIFIIRTLIEQQRLAGAPLYVCFVDFQKAYDTVPRHQLWTKLEGMGIRGFIMDAIQALYANVPVCVRTRTGLTPTFQSLMGVKQGCPLSPTLFGLYIDDWESVILGKMGLFLPRLGGGTAPPLFYADDLALMSTSAEGLQRQLHCLGDYADKWGLTVNVEKTKVVVFLPPRKRRGTPAEVFLYKGMALKNVDSFRYLGIELHSTQPFGSAASALAISGGKALHAMRRRCAELGLSSPDLQLELFDVLVRPVLSYGSEIWATHFLSGSSNPCERLHRSFLRGILGVRQCTPTEVVLAELGRFSLAAFWAKMVTRFWNRLICMADDRLLKQAFHLSLELATRTPASWPAAHRPWAAQVADMFRALGKEVSLGAPTEFAAADIVATVQARELDALTASQKSKVQHYISCIRGGGVSIDNYQPTAYLAAVADRPRRACLAQLRTGSHWLRVETGRWQRLEREQRVCPHCAAGAVEDEMHMIFDCPKYDGVRQQFPALFSSGDRNLGSFLSQDPTAVAEFIYQCYRLAA